MDKYKLIDKAQTHLKAAREHAALNHHEKYREHMMSILYLIVEGMTNTTPNPNTHKQPKRR